MTDWNIHTVDGHYIGQSQARRPETAFFVHMGVHGETPTEVEIRSVETADGGCRVHYHGSEYLVSSNGRSR